MPRGGRNGSEKVLRTPANEDLICEMLAYGRSLADIAKTIGVKHPAIIQWVADCERDGLAFAYRYARAREVGLDLLAEQVIELSDDLTFMQHPMVASAMVQQQRLAVDSRKWFLSKLYPRRYGDKVTQEIVGDSERPIVNRIELVPVAPVLRSPKIIDHED